MGSEAEAATIDAAKTRGMKARIFSALALRWDLHGRQGSSLAIALSRGSQNSQVMST